MEQGHYDYQWRSLRASFYSILTGVGEQGLNPEQKEYIITATTETFRTGQFLSNLYGVSVAEIWDDTFLSSQMPDSLCFMHPDIQPDVAAEHIETGRRSIQTILEYALDYRGFVPESWPAQCTRAQILQNFTPEPADIYRFCGQLVGSARVALQYHINALRANILRQKEKDRLSSGGVAPIPVRTYETDDTPEDEPLPTYIEEVVQLLIDGQDEQQIMRDLQVNARIINAARQLIIERYIRQYGEEHLQGAAERYGDVSPLFRPDSGAKDEAITLLEAQKQLYDWGAPLSFQEHMAAFCTAFPEEDIAREERTYLRAALIARRWGLFRTDEQLNTFYLNQRTTDSDGITELLREGTLALRAAHANGTLTVRALEDIRASLRNGERKWGYDTRISVPKTFDGIFQALNTLQQDPRLRALLTRDERALFERAKSYQQRRGHLKLQGSGLSADEQRDVRRRLSLAYTKLELRHAEALAQRDIVYEAICAFYDRRDVLQLLTPNQQASVNALLHAVDADEPATYEELASATGLSHSALRTRLEGALKKLRWIDTRSDAAKRAVTVFSARPELLDVLSETERKIARVALRLHQEGKLTTPSTISQEIGISKQHASAVLIKALGRVANLTPEMRPPGESPPEG
jgi:hypothetical protein